MNTGSPLAQAYRELRRQSNASMIYQEPAAPVQRQSIYEQVHQPTLEERANAPRPSKWDQKPGQSDQDYTSKLKPYLQALTEQLDPAELERVAAQYNAAIERLNGTAPSHQALRDQLSNRVQGSGIGIAGPESPYARAAVHGRFGGREVQADGATAVVESLAAKTPLSAAEVNQIMAAKEAQRGQAPQHADVSQLRSTGHGFLGVQHG